MTEAPKRLWPVRGFAPGGYWCKCIQCGKSFEGDERAGECAECVLTWLAAEHVHIVSEARRAALEEAAKVAETNGFYRQDSEYIAAAIRAMKHEDSK